MAWRLIWWWIRLFHDQSYVERPRTWYRSGSYRSNGSHDRRVDHFTIGHYRCVVEVEGHLRFCCSRHLSTHVEDKQTYHWGRNTSMSQPWQLFGFRDSTLVHSHKVHATEWLSFVLSAPIIQWKKKRMNSLCKVHTWISRGDMRRAVVITELINQNVNQT